VELTIEQALQQGVAAHKEGNLQEAERLYRAILQSQPAHPDANHNLGVIAVSVNKAEAALPLFKTALEANPKIEQFWLSYIDALIKENQFEAVKQALAESRKMGLAGEKLDVLEAQYKQIAQSAPSKLQEKKKGLTLKEKRQKISESKQQKKKKGKSQNAKSVSPSQSQLNNILEQYQNGQYDEAEMLAVLITQQFPEHQFGWKILGAIFGQTGRKTEALNAKHKAVKLAPQDAEAHGNLGNALKELGRLDEAETSYRQAIALKSDYALAHSNLGNALKELGRLEEAGTSFRQAIALKSDFSEAHSNLGSTQQELGRLEEAEASCRQAIKFKPDFAAAHNNLGNVLKELGRLDEAVGSYQQAIKLKADYSVAQSNLINCLTSYPPPKVVSHPITEANKEIRKIDMKACTTKIISDARVAKLLLKSLNILESYNLSLGTSLSQVYRKNSVDLNCKRHMSIFHKHNVIPRFCFGCYKVQVEPNTIFELVKLLIIFDQLKLEDNNTRKCMIELRPEIPGFYKGLIYCSGLEQANKIAAIIDVIVKKNISSKLSSKVKRGCSEYPFSFPDYKEINNSGPQLMNYNENWMSIEDSHDSKKPILAPKNIRPSLPGLNLQDVLIIRKWIDYAKGIGDPSVNLIDNHALHYHDVFNLARARTVSHPFIK
jgi:tetratricopeptide (TPR) repeat protein